MRMSGSIDEHPRIHICGNIYGCGNIGDDAVLEGILLILNDACPKAKVSVSTDGARPLAFLPPDIVRVPSYDMDAVADAIAGCDLFVSGGGTMIGDELGIEFPLRHNAQRFAIAKSLGKRTMLLGVGANGLRTCQGEQIARDLMLMTDFVTTRDTESYNVCRSLGMPASRMALAADPAFLLGPQETGRTFEIKGRIRRHGKPIGVNMVNEAWCKRSDYKIAVASCLDTLSREGGYTPVFFCNEIRPGDWFDQDANRQTAGFLSCRHEILDGNYLTPREMMDVISAFGLVLSMRMHALIFAAVVGTPFTTVSRVDKVDNFMKQFSLVGDERIEDCNGLRLVETVRNRIAVWSELRNTVAKRVEKLNELALVSGSYLGQVLKLKSHRCRWHAVLPYLSANPSDTRAIRLRRHWISVEDKFKATAWRLMRRLAGWMTR